MNGLMLIYLAILKRTMLIFKELNFKVLFYFSYLTLNEMIDIAMNGEGMNSGVGNCRLWEFAGVYYRYDNENIPMLIIDREFNCE